jgi:predicted unusual protein kinase regulating ubiquinone biosynthesis (AarF/ABC1/UbiB family)
LVSASTLTLLFVQVNLCVEARNLEQFAANFGSVESVRFPKPLWSLVRPYVLVESYEEGVPVQHYVTDRSSGQINTKLAELGIDTILKMVGRDPVTVRRLYAVLFYLYVYCVIHIFTVQDNFALPLS